MYDTRTSKSVAKRLPCKEGFIRTCGSGCSPRVELRPVCVGARFGLAVNCAVIFFVDCRLCSTLAAVLGAWVRAALRTTVTLLAADTAPNAHPQAGLGRLARLRAVLADAGRMVRRRAAFPDIGSLACVRGVGCHGKTKEEGARKETEEERTAAPLRQEAVDRVPRFGVDEIRVRRHSGSKGGEHGDFHRDGGRDAGRGALWPSAAAQTVTWRWRGRPRALLAGLASPPGSAPGTFACSTRQQQPLLGSAAGSRASH
jgi:hypothetical protein